MKHPAPPLRAMLDDLIALPTVSSVKPALNMGNRHLVDRLGEWLAGGRLPGRDPGIPSHPGKSNLLGTLGSGPGGLVLSGHTDTVPFDAPLWNHDPLELTEADGRYYGLGTCGHEILSRPGAGGGAGTDGAGSSTAR